MITRPDDDPDLDPDDPLTILLRPPADHLGPPAGRYEAIRRGATRRKLLRAAAGTAVVCGLAAAVLLPLRLSASEAPASPAVPLAPPPASSPATETGTETQAPTSAPVSPVAGTPSASPSSVPTGPAASSSVQPTPTEQP